MATAEHPDQRPPANAYEALMAAKRTIDARKSPAENHAEREIPQKNTRKEALKAALRALDSFKNDNFKNEKIEEKPETIHDYLARVKAGMLAASGETNVADVFKNDNFKSADGNVVSETEIPFAEEITEEIIGMSGTADISSVLAILNDTFKNFNDHAPHIEILAEEESEENFSAEFPDEAAEPAENSVLEPEVQRDLNVACALIFHEPSLAARTQANITQQAFAQLLGGR
jgi:NH3-dependent NAD+ synthetase